MGLLGYNSISLKRKIPKCYLFSSKFILTSFVVLFSYLIVMDIILFVKIKQGKSFLTLTYATTTTASTSSFDDSNDGLINKLLRAASTTTTTTTTTAPPSYFPPPSNDANDSDFVASPKSSHISSFQSADRYKSSRITSYDSLDDNTAAASAKPKVSVFSLLPVKKIMIAEATHFIRSPIAHFIEYEFGFSRMFPFISANAISLLHCLLSIICIRYLIHDDLFWRQFGVCLFQFRNFLDSFDGVIYRAHARKTAYRSHYGSLGYLVDSSSDVIGGLCLIGSVAIFLLKNPPAHRNPTCFMQNDADESKSSFLKCQPNGSGEKSLSSSFNSKLCYYEPAPQKSSMMATKLALLTAVALFGIRLGLSALFWDRSVHAYEDLLDCIPKSELHQVSWHEQLTT